MNFKLGAAIASVAVALFVLASAAFTVHETEQALVVRFGEVIRPVTEKGLHFKVPVIDDAVKIERRVLVLDPPEQQVILSDQKRMVVDAFARYQIVNPERFYVTLRTEARASEQLGNLLNSNLRNVLGEDVQLIDVLSDKRVGLMLQIRQNLQEAADRLGIHIVDVRIRRADLQEEVSDATFARMRSERQREAAELRAQGEEQAQRTRALADREVTVLLAEAEREAQRLRGEGDAQAIAIYADAFERDPEFYAFYRSLEAYRNAFGEGTTMVLSPDGEFFRYFGEEGTIAPQTRQTGMEATRLPGAPAAPAQPTTAAAQ